MAKSQSIWSKADSFLSLSRKIILNSLTAILLVIVTFIILTGIGSAFSPEDKIDTKNKILWFKPIGVVVDKSSGSSSSIDSIILGSSNTQQHELNDLLDVLNSAAEDKNLDAIYINVSELGMYYASAFEIANAVKNIKDNGKRVIAYGENLGNNAYLISSQANEVILNKYGQISSFGFSRKREYVKDFYENIKLNQHVFIAGEWKTAPEPFTRNDMSEEDKNAWNDFAEPLWDKMTIYIEDARMLPYGTLQNYGDSFWELTQVEPEISQIALKKGLVDKVFTEEELRHWFFEEFPNKDNDINKLPDTISIYDYLSTIKFEENNSKDKIAVIHIEGAITTGESTYGIAGSDTIVKNIRKAIKDDSVKALVLRINSPGGGVYPSELITNSLSEFKDSGRPIVSSMGDIAASGGVWVTTLSDEIWAKNETLTGSIGVYATLPTFEKLYDWVGIQVDGVSSTKAEEWDPRISMPDNVTNGIQATVDNIYDRFINKVSENRSMSYAEVHAVAKGRVWSGEKAIKLGLVDKIGGLDDALDSASKLANIEEYKVIRYFKEMDPLEIFISELIENLDIKIDIGKNYKKIFDAINNNYKFIDEKKDLNMISYCFECEFIKSEYE
ncbi:MAG: signal peptide peptidase SppA [Gammaproteobacteria bacterium]|nr:signal peptide peptidase SppA [Gammaproteobacteria bacterium]